MFKIDDNPTFTHTVKARVPIDGGYDDQPFKVTYGLIPAQEYQALNLDTPEDSKKLFDRVVRSVDDVVGADGEPLPYSDALRDKLYALPWARFAIIRGYFEAIGRAAAGN